MGQRKLVSKGVRPLETGTHDTVTEEDYTIHRIVRGVPEGSREIIPGASFPMEANLDVMGGGAFSTFLQQLERRRITHPRVQSTSEKAVTSAKNSPSGRITPV
jgi:hypothetical protein